MGRFNCNDCAVNGTEACRYGADKSKDYSDVCDDLLVEQDRAYEKGSTDALSNIVEHCKGQVICDRCEHYNPCRGCAFYARPKDWRIKEQKNDQ